MNCSVLEFVQPGQVEMNSASLGEPGTHEVLVEANLSAISPGTEMLVYRGQWPEGVAVDENIEALSGPFSYPLKYGYCSVGKVTQLGKDVESSWLGRRVFAFQPHQSHYLSSIGALLPIPEDIDDVTALFLPSMETAVNLLLDGRPLIGEKAVVIGQGIIGLLTTALLQEFPLGSLITLERYALRRQASIQLGAQNSYDPSEEGIYERLGADSAKGGDTDVIFELSGNPATLNDALALSRFDGRVVIGSWYGTKKSELNLGSFFHRGRLSLISSQVSTLSPDLTGRWHKSRRLKTSWEMLRKVPVAQLITHRFALTDCAQAYGLIDEDPGSTMQVVFDYKDT